MSRTQRRNSNWHHYAANVQDALVSCVLVWSSKHGRFSDFQVVLDVRCLFVFVFTELRYASALCAMGRVSACLSQVGVLLKRLNVRIRKQNHTIAQGL